MGGSGEGEVGIYGVQQEVEGEGGREKRREMRGGGTEEKREDEKEETKTKSE